jgi:NAD(P)-dependent dehydrogenase (short-subunit alcohol dehydrogenase family)
MATAERFAGKVAVVTGSTGGLGEGIARRLASEGASVVISGRRDDEGEAVARRIAEEFGGRAFFHRADVGVPSDCDALIAAAAERFGRVDVLVNNAAALAQHEFDEITPEQWDAAFAANVRGPFLLSRAVVPHLRAQGGGSIINIGTGMAYRGGALDRVAYSASKGALLTLTKNLAAELIRDRIRVNWIIVGWLATPQELALRDQTHGDGEKYLRESGERRPLGRHEVPEDIAAGAAYLASDDGSHVTGCELNITGGLRI